MGVDKYIHPKAVPAFLIAAIYTYIDKVMFWHLPSAVGGRMSYNVVAIVSAHKSTAAIIAPRRDDISVTRRFEFIVL